MTDEAKMIAALDRAFAALDFSLPIPCWRGRHGERRWIRFTADETIWYDSDEELASILRTRGMLP